MLSHAMLRRSARCGGARGLVRGMASVVRASHHRLYDRRDTEFVLHELGSLERDETVTNVLNSCESFVEAWHHVDAILDKSPPQLVPEASGTAPPVKSHPLTKDWIDAFRAHGFAELSELGLPFAVQCAAQLTLGGAASSNLVGYFVLTRCAADLLEAHGTAALKDRYLAPLRSADFFGTMALSEPQAGSSLSTIRTLATPYDGPGAEDGEFRLRGDKMWTTGAFHDQASNIVHMLLARTPGAEAGARGLSLFLVPNVLQNGEPNDVELIGLNKKMGHRAITNCAWSLGGRADGAVGYLVGREGGGLACMFEMMNAMRIEVGLGATCLGKRGLLESLLYAQEREQGGCPIIEHADVKRLLLQQKVYAEGSYALCMHAAELLDNARAGDAKAGALLELLPEVVKSWPSEWCLEANKLAIQVLGGSGYVSDYPCEQLYRDNRLNMIHEGTAGIHALTLLGRKVQGGKAAPLFEAMRKSAEDAEALLAAEGGGASAEMAEGCLMECSAALRAAVSRAEDLTAMLTAEGVDKRAAMSNAHDYLTFMGHTCVAWQWMRSANAAARGLRALALAGGGAADEEHFYYGKLHACRFFFRHELPAVEPLAARLERLDPTVAQMQPGWF